MVCCVTGIVLLGSAPWSWVSAQQVHPTPDALKHVSGIPIVRLIPGSEALHLLLAHEVDSAAKRGQLALVDLGTKDCEVCHVFHNALSDPAMIAALKGTRLIEMDYDDWSFQATTDGFQFSGALPVIFVVTSDGRMGAVFNHAAWDDQRNNLGANATNGQIMGPPLQNFLTHVRDSIATLDRTVSQGHSH